MSPVDRANSVNGTNFVFCSYEKFQPGRLDKIRKTKKQNKLAQKRCIIRDFRSFVNSFNFTNKDNSHTSELEIHKRQNYAFLSALLRKRSYFVKKVSPPVAGMECSYGKNFRSVADILVEKRRSRQPIQPILSYENSEIFSKDLGVWRDLGIRTSPVNRSHM